MEASVAELTTAINTLWVLVTGFLVFFMQLGFGKKLGYPGMVRYSFCRWKGR